ncbi:hypothetical protein [Mumia sp. DW29H23]|uniref:hypothetical protein n=1 Tax=Mumia sp. DW29H23 TaxID=3421241 RepID=UPI003D69BF33
MTDCPTPTKRRHRSKDAALAQITSLYSHGRGNPDLNAYRCVCGSWHVGHSSWLLRKRIRRALRRRPR